MIGGNSDGNSGCRAAADVIRTALRQRGVDVNDKAGSWVTKDGRSGIIPGAGQGGNPAQAALATLAPNHGASPAVGGGRAWGAPGVANQPQPQAPAPAPVEAARNEILAQMQPTMQPPQLGVPMGKTQPGFP